MFSGLKLQIWCTNLGKLSLLIKAKELDLSWLVKNYLFFDYIETFKHLSKR